MRFVGLDTTFQQLERALTNCSLIFLIGPPKSGKSSLVNHLLATADPPVTRIDVHYTEFHSHKEFQNSINKVVATRSILEMINSTEKIVVIEDIDSLHVQDRYALGYMHTFITTHDLKACRTRIILTCPRTEERRIAELQKHANSCVIHVESPSTQDLYTHFIQQEKYKMNKREFEIMCKRYRNSFADLKAHLDSATLQLSDAQDYNDATLYEFVEKLMKRKPFSHADIESILANEPNITTLMLYENIVNQLKPLKLFHALTRSYIDSTILEEYAYRATEWDLLEHVAVIRAHSASIALSQIKLKSKIVYTQIPSKSAQYYVNSKRISKVCDQLKLDYYDFLELCHKVWKGDEKLTNRSDESVCSNLIIRNLTGKLFL